MLRLGFALTLVATLLACAARRQDELVPMGPTPPEESASASAPPAPAPQTAPAPLDAGDGAP